MPVGDVAQLALVRNRQRPAADLDQTIALEHADHPADVHRREAGRVSDVPVPQWEFHGRAALHAALVGLLREIEDQPRDALIRRATSEIER